VPRPVTVPTPAVFAKLTTVELSPVSRLPPASRISAVSVFAEPEATLEGGPRDVGGSGAPRGDGTLAGPGIAVAPILPLTVTAWAAVEDMSVSVYVPLPLSVAAQLDVHDDGNVPSVVDSVTLLPPVERLLPAASFA